MAAEACALAVTDYTGDREGGPSDVIHLQAVSMDLTMFEVKELICGEKKDPKFTAANTLVFMGKILLEDKKKLKTYNRSHRTQLVLELHDLKHINVTVKTLQHCGSGRCVAVPLWAFCCQQRISLKIPSHETVGYLRHEIANELGDPVGHPAPKLQLYFRRSLLDNDLEDLRTAGLVDGSSVTVFVRMCFFRKKPADRGQTTDADGSSRSPAASPSPRGAAVGSDEAAGAVEASPHTQESQPQAVVTSAADAAASSATVEGAQEHGEAVEAVREPAETPQEAKLDTEAAGGATSP